MDKEKFSLELLDFVEQIEPDMSDSPESALPDQIADLALTLDRVLKGPNRPLELKEILRNTFEELVDITSQELCRIITYHPDASLSEYEIFTTTGRLLYDDENTENLVNEVSTHSPAARNCILLARITRSILTCR